MNTTEAIRIALQSLWANKLRSVLTLLGVVIGVSAVIAVVTFVNGINGYVAEKIFNLGADVFIVSKMPNVITDVDQFIEGNKRKDVTMEEYEAVRDGCSACKVVGASIYNLSGNVAYGTENSTDTFIRGWTPSMARIYDLDLVMGRAVNDIDVNNASPVVVIGWDIRDNLLGATDPIGKEIRVDGRLYRVIGVGKKEGKTLGQSRDNWVMLPITTWFKAYGEHKSVSIWAKAEDVGAPMEQAIDQSRVIMRARRHDAIGAERQLLHRDQRQFPFAVGEPERHVFYCDDRDRVDFADRGRHRHHEHHAGVGDRADARDRHSQGAGRAAARCAAAVPDRIDHHGADGRAGRCSVRDWHREGGDAGDRNAVGHQDLGDFRRSAGLGQRGHFLRCVSGEESREAGSDCGIAV